MTTPKIALVLSSALLGLAAPARGAEQTETNSDAKPQVVVAEAQEPAQSAPAETAGTVPSNPNDGKWHFATIGYAWFAGAWGKTDVIGPVPPVDLDLPFGKVLKAFKFAFMGAAEARHDRFVVLGDLTFIHLDAHEGIGIRDPDFLKAELDSRTAEITLLPGYRIADKGPVTVDLLAGGRMNWFKTTLQLKGPNREADGDVKHEWLDPLIGARIGVPLGGKWSAGIYGDVGGFGIGSKFTWQLAPTINYQISRKMNVGAGWRYWKVNYRDGDFLYNVHQSGPVIAFRTAM
ncbi:MAG TPA: hypothetical protein VHE36_04220 [Sphingomicrobium sp.]|nr:hypothetical protein [Sphingomicrobium sp.]